jgi:hypothetical protein
MGGSNSGRWGSRKPFAEHLGRIDLKVMRKQHPLCRGSVLTLTYKRPNGREVMARVSMAATDTAFGGTRLWFRCPGCSRRCQVLYGGAGIACRTCQGLRYRSQAEDPTSRANRAMCKIAKRIDPRCNMGDLPPKPPGMHWTTYDRLAERYDAQSEKWAILVMRRFRLR